MNQLLKFLAWFAGIALLIGLYFSDNIWGYYRFKEICKKDAGLRVYEQLEKGEGWQVSRKADADYLLAYYEGISFVRYSEERKPLQDLVRTTDKKNSSDDGFRPQAVDGNRQPRYEYRTEVEAVPKEARMNRYVSTVTSIRSGKLAVIYQDFTYRLFNPDWGLGRGTACSSFDRDESDKGPNDSQEIAIRKAFTR